MLASLKKLITKDGIEQAQHLSARRFQSDILSKTMVKIKATGPITVFEYMQEVLNMPHHGYYSSHPRIGPKGDFITSPELSQVFGELLGVWLVSEWMKQGRPSKPQIVEMGPGNATLTEDIIRILSQLKVHNEFARVNLIETSPYFTKVQFNRLCKKENLDKPTLCTRSGFTKFGLPVFWYDSVKDIPVAPSYFVANEFFDALPIHQFKRVDGQWREVMIDRDGDDKLRFILPSFNTTSITAYSHLFQDLTSDKVEVNPLAIVATEYVSSYLKDGGIGSCIIVDYGDEESRNFTLRGFKNHKEWNVLLEPGTADLTADVNFGLLKNFASKYVTVHGPVTQNAFLHRMGVRERIAVLLKKSVEKDQKNDLIKSYEYLTSDKFMGERFKVLALTTSDKEIPYGFDY